MILLGLGGNLPHMKFRTPRGTLEAALDELAAHGGRAIGRSRWYTTAPVPDVGQPWFTNAVAALETNHGPEGLLALLLEVEAKFGRTRGMRNASRTIDLDLLAYHDHISKGSAAFADLQVPHPRLHERAFVLLPLAEIAPSWRHPVLGQSVPELIAALPPEQVAGVRLAEGQNGTQVAGKPLIQ
jgi:2-amino-4-hydroxy-6-hydroxymethyldihydropteridine diphosphokinase